MYIVEGNIGSGKTTLVKMLVKHISGALGELEPVEQWQKVVQGQSLLRNFYQDRRRWAYTLETFIMLSRVRDYLVSQKSPNPYFIIERSVYSGNYCFALNNYEMGDMNGLEWELYTHWFTFMVPGKCIPPRGFIYLRVNPEIVFERIKKRDRHEERPISYEYVERLHRYHDQFLLEKKHVLPELISTPVLVLDGNSDFEHNPHEGQRLVHEVELFFNQTRL